jgi:hypothetical protein
MEKRNPRVGSAMAKMRARRVVLETALGGDPASAFRVRVLTALEKHAPAAIAATHDEHHSI